MNVWDSARDGRPEVVSFLIQKEPRMANQKDENDVTPLCYAVLGNQPACVRLLIEHGAKVNTPSKTSVPLVFAAMNGNVETTKILLEHNSKIRALNKHGITPFHAAVTNGGANSAKLLQMMLEADPPCVNYLSPSIGTGLHAACSEGCPIEIVQLLVEGGTDVKLLIPDSGRTALHCAAGRGNHKVVEYLLSKGADSVINVRDSQGMSALDLAALGGHTLACELLINAGAETSGESQEQGMTPLFYAVQRPTNMETIFRLLEKGLRADHVTKPKVTPLHIASSVPNCEEIVNILLKNGADINAKDCDDNTPAHYALLNNNVDGYNAMVSREADLTIKNSRGYTVEELYNELKEKHLKQGAPMQRDPTEVNEEPRLTDENPSTKICAGCGNRESKPNTFKRCSKCKKVNYCSQSCQLKDWKLGHSKRCGSA